MVAQSIGGGGGAGGSATASGSKVYANATIGVGGTGGAAGNGGTVNFYFDGSHDNKIATAGYSAYGVLMQSIGGGGGQGADGSDQANGTITVGGRSEGHTSEHQSLMRISYAVFRVQERKQCDSKRSPKKERVK